MKQFFRRHPALSVTAVWFSLIIALDRLAGLSTIAIVLALLWGITIADAWDEEKKP